ncbi:hypothetical protein EV1_005823 [Malus domestica]
MVSIGVHTKINTQTSTSTKLQNFLLQFRSCRRFRVRVFERGFLLRAFLLLLRSKGGVFIGFSRSRVWQIPNRVPL